MYSSSSKQIGENEKLNESTKTVESGTSQIRSGREW